MARPEELAIETAGVSLPGDLTVPDDPIGLVVFAHGSGSSRQSPRNRFVAETLADRGLATLLFDLLTPAEDADRANRFDIPRLTERLVGAATFLADHEDVGGLPLGFFGSSTGAAAALEAAAALPERTGAVVSRGGRADMAADVFETVRAPTLLIVGGADTQVLDWNRDAAERLACPTEVAVVEGAGHLFEGEGELAAVAALAADWFVEHLG